jgi:lysophospholipase L1-like esterase
VKTATPGRRQPRFAAAAVFLSLAASLLLLECFVRLYYRREVDSLSLRGDLPPSYVVPFLRRIPDPELLYDLQPGARLIGWGAVRVEIDPSGCCRVLPGRRADDAGSLRIAILGDSTPFGWKTPYEKTYGHLLRSLLQRALRKSVAIRNFAVPSYNSQQNRVVFEKKVLPWRPDLVILHYDHNDAHPVDDTPAGHMYPEYGDNPLHSMLFKLVKRRLRRLARVRSTIVMEGAPAHAENLYQGYRYSGPQFEQHFREMKRIADLAAAGRIPIIAFIWNPWLKPSARSESDPFYALLHKPVSDRLRALGYRVADSYDFYQGHMRGKNQKDLSGLWTNPQDAHPNAEGHRLIARYLLREVLKAHAAPTPSPANAEPAPSPGPAG